MQSESPPLSLRARRILTEAGCGAKSTLHALAGGGNNRVYRVVDGQRSFLLKEYFSHTEDPRDRLGAEFGFTTFAWQSGIRCIPEPIARDAEEGIALYGFVDGKEIGPGEVGAIEIRQAVDFVAAVNSHRCSAAAEALPVGSEACFSINRHLETVSLRLDRLRRLPVVSPLDHEALTFVEGELSEAFLRVSEQVHGTMARQKWSLDINLTRDEQVISPSDFGFHNALRSESGRIIFLDFEYAGWDDPAKLVGDFFSQVAVPVQVTYKKEVLGALSALTPDPGAALRRMHLLLPLYRIKWCCIILNHFVPVEAERKAFAAAGLSPERKARQLGKAREWLAAIDQLSN